MCLHLVVIVRQLENRTVCRGSDVTISCEYQCTTTPLPVTWIINGTLFTQQEIMDSPLYELNNPTTPRTHSLTVFSLNGTTTFQCTIHSSTNVASTHGTVNVTNGESMYYICKILVNNYT